MNMNMTLPPLSLYLGIIQVDNVCLYDFKASFIWISSLFILLFWAFIRSYRIAHLFHTLSQMQMCLALLIFAFAS